MLTLLGTDPGDDTLNGADGNDRLFGNEGDDELMGGRGDDVLEGGRGADRLFGDEGSDSLFGGPGADELTGGLRGGGWTDFLEGGEGADLFYLDYTRVQGVDGTGWWDGYDTNVIANIGEDITSTIVTSLVESAKSQFFSSLPGGALLSGLSSAAGATVNFAITQLLAESNPVTPPRQGDALIITDFDPREDVLFVPESTTQVLSIDTAFITAPNGQSGWGARFFVDSEIFAYVFLDEQFTSEFGLFSGDGATAAFLTEVFTNSFKVNQNGLVENRYNAPTDASSYVDGVVPIDNLSQTFVTRTTPGVDVRVFGAFAPIANFQPAAQFTIIYMYGTNMGDIVSVNATRFAPEDYLMNQLTTAPSLVKSFAGDDIVLGGNGQDRLYGGEGDDQLYTFRTSNPSGDPIEESVFGETGDDVIFTGDSKVLVDGGEGDDTVDYSLSIYSVNVDFLTNSAQDTGDGSDPRNIYRFVDVENANGTNNDDVLAGGNGVNVLSGGRGNDTIVEQGTGLAIASYEANPGKVEVDLSLGTAFEYDPTGTTIEFTDTLIEVRGARGSKFGDDLKGSDRNDFIEGGDGDDTIAAGDGLDTIFSGDGNDWIEAGAGNDEIDTGDGEDTVTASDADDIITGGLGNKLITAAGGNDKITTLSGDDTITSESGNATIDAGNGENDITTGNGSDDIKTGSGNDTIVSSGGRNEISAGSGTNEITTGNGNDRIFSGAGRDIIDAGNGNNTVGAGEGDNDVTTGNGNDNITTRGGNDEIRTGDGVNTVSAGNGNNTVHGGAAKDSVTTGSGADRIFVFDGENVVDAGGGNNRVEAGTDDDTITTGGGSDIIRAGDGNNLVNSGGGNDDVITGGGDDTVNAGAGNDRIDLNGGDDLVDPGAGDDVILAGAGNDTYVYSGSGNDIFEGDVGFDTIDMRRFLEDGTSTPFFFTAWNEEKGGLDGSAGIFFQPIFIVDFFSVEKIIGTDRDDVFIVASQNRDPSEVVLEGLDGDDRITVEVGTAIGGAGDDEISGNGILIGGLGDDDIQSRTLPYVDTLIKWQIGDGNDTFFGDGPHLKTLELDMSNGPNGVAQPVSFSYNNSRDELTIVAGQSQETITAIGLTNIVVFTASAGTPITGQQALVSAGVDLTVAGTSGNDFIAGNRIDDDLLGGEGNDTLRGERGDDHLDGQEGDDKLKAGRGDDTVEGGSGKDFVRGGRGDDSIDGGSGGDILRGDRGEDTLDGGRGKDILLGGRDDDHLSGGTGDDILKGGRGYDDLWGGAGADLFVFKPWFGADTIHDFDPMLDQIGLSGGLSYDKLRIVEGDDTTLIFNKKTLVAELIGAFELDENDFVFV